MPGKRYKADSHTQTVRKVKNFLNYYDQVEKDHKRFKDQNFYVVSAVQSLDQKKIVVDLHAYNKSDAMRKAAELFKILQYSGLEKFQIKKIKD